MWIVGDDKTLTKNRLWGSLIRDASERNSVVTKALFEELKNLNFEDIKKGYNGKSLKKYNFKSKYVPTEKAVSDDTKDRNIGNVNGEDELTSKRKESGNSLSLNELIIKSTDASVKSARSDDSKVIESCKLDLTRSFSKYDDDNYNPITDFPSLRRDEPTGFKKIYVAMVKKFEQLSNTFTQVENKKQGKG